MPAAASQSFKVLESARNDAHSVESETCPHSAVSATAPHTVESATEPHSEVSARLPDTVESETSLGVSETSPGVSGPSPEVPQGEASSTAPVSTLPHPHLVPLDRHSSHPVASLDDAVSHGTVCSSVLWLTVQSVHPLDVHVYV